MHMPRPEFSAEVRNLRSIRSPFRTTDKRGDGRRMTKGKEQTMARGDFERYRKSAWRDQFLIEINQVVKWSNLSALVEPMYPKGEAAGRPPVDLERMLRIHGLQH